MKKTSWTSFPEAMLNADVPKADLVLWVSSYEMKQLTIKSMTPFLKEKGFAWVFSELLWEHTDLQSTPTQFFRERSRSESGYPVLSNMLFELESFYRLNGSEYFYFPE